MTIRLPPVRNSCDVNDWSQLLLHYRVFRWIVNFCESFDCLCDVKTLLITLRCLLHFHALLANKLSIPACGFATQIFCYLELEEF